MPPRDTKRNLIITGGGTFAIMGLLMVVFVLLRLREPSSFPIAVIMLSTLVPFACLAFMAISHRRSSDRRDATHIREMLQVQRELNKTARRYKSLLEGAGNAIFVFNADNGHLVEVNRRGMELLGYSKEEMAALRGKDLVPDQEQEQFSSLVLRVARRGSGRSDKLSFRRKDGRLLIGEVDARLIDLGDERLVHAIVRDVTFRHRAEREIRQRNRELSTLISIIGRASQEMELDTVLDVTLSDTIDVFGTEGGGIHLRDREGRLQPAACANIPEQLAQALGGSDPGTGLLERIATDRSLLACEDLSCDATAAALPPVVRNWKGFVGVPLTAGNHVIGVMYLVTREARLFSDEELALFSSIASQMGIVIEHARLFNELKWKSDELLRSFRLLEQSSHELALSQHRLRENLQLVERANQELARIDRMKSTFLGIISHEFRTPLTSVISGTDFLLTTTGSLDDDTRRVIEMIHQGGARLTEILCDIEKVAQLETNMTPMSCTACSIASLLDQVLAKLHSILTARRLTVILGNMERLPPCNGDPECIEDILSELLENAIKFTADGGTIMVSARVVDRQALEGRQEILSRFNGLFFPQMADRKFLEVEVRDNGIGVGYDEQVKIFDKFYEIGDIEHHSTGKFKFQGKGTGLGLAIVKGMVEAHGGMVWVESAGATPVARPGSAFFVLLPLDEHHRRESLPLDGGGKAPWLVDTAPDGE